MIHELGMAHALRAVYPLLPVAHFDLQRLLDFAEPVVGIPVSGLMGCLPVRDPTCL